jgi:hypothetical protein
MEKPPLPPAPALLADGQLEETEDRWKNLPQELLMNIVKCLQREDLREGCTIRSSSVVRLACQSWRRIFDAACTRLKLQIKALAPLEFPAVLCGLCGRMPQLSVLDLRSWEFGVVSDTEKAKVMQAVSGLTNLRELLFASAPAMTVQGLESVAECTALTRLQLDDFEMRRKLVELRTFEQVDEGSDDADADDADDERDIARAVGGLTALTSLNLEYWFFKATALEAFSKLTALTELNLGHCKLDFLSAPPLAEGELTTGEFLLSVFSLPNLTDLNLAKTPFLWDYTTERAGVECWQADLFGSLTSLTRLNLYGTIASMMESESDSMTLAVLRGLSRLPALTHLNIASECSTAPIPSSGVDILCDRFATLSTLTIDSWTLNFFAAKLSPSRTPQSHHQSFTRGRWIRVWLGRRKRRRLRSSTTKPLP